MATSLVATGVQFPDSTIQTTAAGAGGSSLEAVASGALSDGSTVIVNANGTVSVVAAVAQAVGTPVVFETGRTRLAPSVTYDSTNARVVVTYADEDNSNFGTAAVGTVSGTSITFGTPVVFESASITSTFQSSVFDTTNSKIVIAYIDGGNSSHGTAIVGTVSGTSISFGSAVVFNANGTTEISAVYDSANSKVVIAYGNGGNSGYGTAIVGTVSGTSISFGTAVVFESANSDDTSQAFDTTNNKIVIAYKDVGNSNHGTAIVGTVSSTSISFGTAVVFESASTDEMSAAYDSNQQKIVIAYKDVGNSSYGTAIVGTVSGTSISFGTAVVFESAEASYNSASYDVNAKKITIAYRDHGNSNFGTAIVGTVSGTSISFGTAVVFESAETNGTSTTYDSTSNKIVIVYKDDGNTEKGTAVVFQNASTNLTAENYIGISDGAYADTATATIQLVGSVDDAQTGLTAGQKYYVQTDGTLGLSPASPSVLAGTAQSATKLIIKR
jgi:hypothetical protein